MCCVCGVSVSVVCCLMFDVCIVRDGDGDDDGSDDDDADGDDDSDDAGDDDADDDGDDGDEDRLSYTNIKDWIHDVATDNEQW